MPPIGKPISRLAVCFPGPLYLKFMPPCQSAVVGIHSCFSWRVLFFYIEQFLEASGLSGRHISSSSKCVQKRWQQAENERKCSFDILSGTCVIARADRAQSVCLSRKKRANKKYQWKVQVLLSAPPSDRECWCSHCERSIGLH